MPKCKMTRPDFLMKFLNGEITPEEIKKIIPEHYTDMYCCYNVLQPFDFDHSTIISASYDAEGRTFCILTDSSKHPKKIKEKCHKQTLTLSDKEYLIKIKAKEKFVYIEIISLDDE